LGLGCEIFLYPSAKTLLPFVISLFVVAYAAAWIAKSSHIGYVGLQMFFGFLVVGFQSTNLPKAAGGEFGRATYNVQSLTAPVVLTQGRDRVIGIFLALLVMWLIFHQVHPKRTIDRVRKALCNLLRLEAKQLSCLLEGDHAAEMALRSQIHQTALEIRSLSEAIPYEFDRHVERDTAQADLMQRTVSNAGSLFLHLKALRDSDLPMTLYADLFAAVPAKLIEIASALESQEGQVTAWSDDERATITHGLAHPSVDSALTSLTALHACYLALAEASGGDEEDLAKGKDQGAEASGTLAS
jgi:hypothetical protein